jgi:hypothetical protein
MHILHSSEEVSTGSRRTSNPSSLYCSTISDKRGSSMVNLFSQPCFLNISSLVIIELANTLFKCKIKIPNFKSNFYNPVIEQYVLIILGTEMN